MRRRRFGVSFLLLATASALGGQTPSRQPTTAAEAVALVRHYYFQQDFASGAEAGRSLVERFPTHHELRAWALVNTVRYQPSTPIRAAVDSFARQAPRSPWPLFARSAALAFAHDSVAAAVRVARRVRAMLPAHPDAIWLHGLVLHRAERYTDVVRLVDSTARQRTPWGELYVLKGNALASMPDTASRARARTAFAEARRIEPANLNAHFVEAVSVSAADVRDTTRWALIAKAVALAPRSSSVLTYFWRFLRAHPTLTPAQKDSAASAVLQRFMGDGRPTAATLAEAAVAHGELRRAAEQHTLEERVLSEFSTSVEAERLLARRIRALGDSIGKEEVSDTARAYRDLRQMRRAFLERPRHLDQNVLGSVLIGYYFQIRDDSSVSADSLKRLGDWLIEVNRINPHITHLDLPKAVAERRGHFRWAERLIRIGDSISMARLKDRRDRYQRQRNVAGYAVALDEARATTHDALGWIYLHEGRIADAERELGQASTLSKTDPAIYFHLGRLAEAKGDLREAQRRYALGMPFEGQFRGRSSTEALRRLYSLNHGSMAGFDAYVEQLRAEERVRRRREIAGKRLTTGERMPTFSLERYGASGTRVTDKELKGKIVVMNFWGVWCGPCVAEAPQIQQFHEAIRNDTSVVFLTVDYNDPLPTLDTFMKNRKFTFPVLLAPNAWVEETIKISAWPTTFVWAPDGTLAFVETGASDHVLSDLGIFVELLRGETRVTP